MIESRNRTLGYAFAVLVLSFGLTACQRGNAARHTDALIVCPGAEGVSWKQFHGIEQLTYQVKVEYPADGMVACISKQLSENGWQPLQEDFWNPGLPSSQVRGWGHFTDATVHPETTVDAWATQWRNQAGDVAWYFLQYRNPPQGRSTLSITAGFIPADKAKNVPKIPQTPKSR